MKGVSKAVEEDLGEELSEIIIARALEGMAPSSAKTLEVKLLSQKLKHQLEKLSGK